MAEHRLSEPLPVGPTQLGNNDEKDQHEKERVGESPRVTESKQNDSASSIEHSVERNSETLIVPPSSILQKQSFGTPQF